VVIVVVLVVANILADRYTKSLDTTSNKRYSLSDQTAKIVKGLKQNATITYFNQSRSFREGKDLLDQYSNLSPKIHVAYVDPDKDPQVAREAGIRNLGTAVVQLGQKKEEAKSMTEEGITGAFIRELKDNTRNTRLITAIATDSRDLKNFSRKIITKARQLTCFRRLRCRAIAPSWWSRDRHGITNSRKWMQLKSMSKAADGRCLCLTRRSSWGDL
jgi:ABC-type uncharacterized transport system involved in gliding motility auxiliary subunit